MPKPKSIPGWPKPKSKRFKYRQQCPFRKYKCGYKWWSMVPHPKECPKCKRRLDTPFARKAAKEG